MALVGLGVLAIVVGVVINASGGSEPVVQAKPVVKSINISWDNPRVQKVVEWANAIYDGNDFVLTLGSDLTALQEQTGTEPDRLLPTLDNQARQEVEQIVLKNLKEGEATLVFRDFEPGAGQLDDESMATGSLGSVLLEMTARPDSVYAKAAEKSGGRHWADQEARVRVSFVTRGTDFQVTGWEKVYVPKRPTPKRPKREPHPEIATPTITEREWQGETIKVAESELVPLEHLTDTPAELRKEIDDLVIKLMDIDAPGGQANRCIHRLKKIGRPAVPRILTKMYELSPKTMEERLQMRRVVQALRDMTGVAFGYNVVDRADMSIGGTDEERLSALKQWYAWWYKNHDRDFTQAIDKADDESIFLTDEDKKMLEAEGNNDARR